MGVVWGNPFDFSGLAQSINGQPLPMRIASWSFVIALPLAIMAFIAYALVNPPEPPPFYRDVVPEEQWVCDVGTVELERVERVNAFWKGLCWPEWPDPILVSKCPSIAPEGVAMWAPENGQCNDLSQEGGCVRHDWDHNATTIYMLPWPQIQPEVRDCLPEHEGGHARGLVDIDNPTRHTDAASSVMAARCGLNLKWLDRCPDGDWPY